MDCSGQAGHVMAIALKAVQDSVCIDFLAGSDLDGMEKCGKINPAKSNCQPIGGVALAQGTPVLPAARNDPPSSSDV